MKKLCVGFTIAGLVFSLHQNSNAGPLARRHQLELRLGMWNQVTDVRTEVSPGGTVTSVKSNGMSGGLAYGRWLDEGLAFQLAVGLMSADVTTETGINGTSTETAVVASILVGTKLYYPASTYGGSVRPFVRLVAGPYIGNQTLNETGVVNVSDTRTEAAFGGHVGAGVDFLLGSHFLTGLSVGYNLMTDFEEPIGGSRNYSGPEGALTLSVVF